MRLGLCCLFRDEPIKFVTTTATASSKMNRPDALAKLSRLCLENAAALLAALQFCADNGIGCFRVNSRILPKPERHHDFIDVKDFPTCWRRQKITVEVEAKAKEAAVLKLQKELGKSRQPRLVLK